MNNSNWTFVGPNVHSQSLFFHTITKQMLNNLIQRFKNKTIVKDIMSIRNTDPTLNKKIVITTNINRSSNPSLYINYNLGSVQLFHLSIHLSPTHYNTKSNGVLHFKQNRTRKTKLVKIGYRSNNNNSIKFHLGKNMENSLNVEFDKEAQIVLDVLNSYFDPTNPNYLGNYTSIRNYNLNTIYQAINKSRTTAVYNKTRKI